MRQRIVAGSILGVLVSLVCATSASATLTLDPPSATPGSVVTVTAGGGSFSTAAGVSNVKIRLSTRNGLLLKSEAPDSSGRINTTFVVPPTLAAGTYLIIGTQTNDATVVQVPGSNPPVFVPQDDPYKSSAIGTQRSFTPSRAVLRVRAAGTGTPTAAVPGGGGDGGPGARFALFALLLVPGLLVAASVRTARRRATRGHSRPGRSAEAIR